MDTPKEPTEAAIRFAKSARERLGKALGELQVEDAPPVLFQAAGAVARSMGSVLEFVEQAPGSSTDRAIAALRDALATLQGIQPQHPAVDAATSQVAAALGLMHSVVELNTHPMTPVEPEPASVGRGTPDTTDTVKVGRRRGADSQREPVPSSSQVVTLKVTLGSHSPSNFYCTLEGRDVLESGGVFLATYDRLELGQQVRLKIELPDGREFEAYGSVRWQRSAPKTASMIPHVKPGYGIELTRVPEAARRLITSYAQRRQPLLHEP